MFTQFPNQTSIYTPTAANATYCYRTSPHQALYLDLYGLVDRIMDFPKGKNNRFFWVDERVFSTIVDWHTSAPKDEMPAENTYSSKAMMILNINRTPIQKQPEALLCLIGLSRRYYLGDEVYPTFLHDDDRDMDLFSLIRVPNPTKVKTGTNPHVAHEVPLVTVTASRVIQMEDPAAGTDSSRVPSIIERSPLDFTNENPSQQSTGPEDQGQEAVAPEVPPLENVTTTGVAPESTRGRKSLAAIELGMGSTHTVPASQGAPVDVTDLDLLSFADPQSRPSADVTQSSNEAATARDPKSKNTSFTSMVASPESLYRPELGMTNDCMLDAPEASRRDKRILARENEIKNLETLPETESDMKKAAEGRSAEVSKELENMQALFLDLHFKQYEDNQVEQCCAEMDACLDALSIDFDEELYPHLLTAIAGRRWESGHGLRLAVMKCGESTELKQAFADIVSAGIANGMSKGRKHGVKHKKANLSLEAIEAYDPEAKAKYITALHGLKDLKYPIVDQLGSLKDAPIDVIMASLHMKSDTGDDAPHWIHELYPSSSQLTIPVYPEACDPTDP
nr:transposase (putative), gypsy type [Tanacetum cinerariifolium]